MRGLDGVFSAITTPLAVAMSTMEFQGKERSFALGIFTAAVGLGEAFLPLLAGFGVFFVMMPINPLMQLYFFGMRKSTRQPVLAVSGAGDVVS